MICMRRTVHIRSVGHCNLLLLNPSHLHYRTLHEPIFLHNSGQFFPRPPNSSFRTASHVLNRLDVNSTGSLVEFHPTFILLHGVESSPEPLASKSLAALNKSTTLGPEDPNKSEKKLDDDQKKLTLWQRIKKEIRHYYHGFRLLGLEVKIASGICLRLLFGHTLTRRERKQLVRTVADIIRLVPFAVFIIVPFMEFLLPFYLKFFPFMLPSTFEDKSAQSDKIQQKLRAKLELTRFLQETLNQTTGVSTKEDGTPTITEFQDFLKKVQESGLPPTNEELVRFSKLFEDQVTLDSLHARQLKMLCQLLSLPTIGPRTLLKLQLHIRVRQLKAEDKLLAKEGVDQIPSWELQSLCQERGMRSVGLTEERLRSQLGQWLSLHLEQNVPITLLLFSRALHVYKLTAEEVSLKDAIAQLPSSASEEVTARVLEALPSSDIDPLTKIEVLRKEQASIKADRAQRKQELAEEQSAAKAAKTEPASETLEDTAPTLKGLPAEDVEAAKKPPLTPPITKPSELPVPTTTAVPPDLSAPCATCAAPEPKMVEKPVEEMTEISTEDLTQIQTAIATSSAFQEEAIEGLKDEVAETAKMRQQHEASLVSTERPADKRTSKAAARLAANVNRMIGEMDHMIEKLNDERQQLLKDIELREVHVKHSSEPAKKTEMLDAIEADHQRVIDINDLMLALRRIQKVPDDTRWQKILEVLDEDHDGKIELQHVLSVIKLLGSENVKLNSKEVTRVLEMIDNEELIETVDSGKTANATSASPNENSSKVPSITSPKLSNDRLTSIPPVPPDSNKHSSTDSQPKKNLPN